MIIGFSGRKESGKSTAANFLDKELGVRGQSARVEYIASPIRDIAIHLFGASTDAVYGTDVQKQQILRCGHTARHVLDELARCLRGLDPDVFIRRFVANHEPNESFFTLVPDMRFPSEVDAVHRLGGIVVRLTRDVHHSTSDLETQLDNLPAGYRESGAYFDFVIDNEGKSECDKNVALMETVLPYVIKAKSLGRH